MLSQLVPAKVFSLLPYSYSVCISSFTEQLRTEKKKTGLCSQPFKLFPRQLPTSGFQTQRILTHLQDVDGWHTLSLWCRDAACVSSFTKIKIPFGMSAEAESGPTLCRVSEKSALAMCVDLAGKVLCSAVGPALVSRGSHAFLLIFSKEPSVNHRGRPRES